MKDKEINKNNTFTLFDNENGNSYEIPIIEGSTGPNVLDIRNLYETQIGTFSDSEILGVKLLLN